jgi:uncharacterized repeat protein (TIGR01451 family)
MALSSTSPAIDAISPGTSGCGTTVTTDQRGVARPQGSGCDIGAYEYGEVAMQSLAASVKKVPTGSNLTYAATVVNSGGVGASGVTLSDALPAGEKFKSASTSLGTCSCARPDVACLALVVGEEGQIREAARGTDTSSQSERPTAR